MSVSCPDCTGEAKEKKIHLSEDEWVMVLTCSECEFAIETESNLAREDKQQRRHAEEELF